VIATRRRSWRSRLVIYGGLALFFAYVLGPVYVMVVTSITPERAQLSVPPVWIPSTVDPTVIATEVEDPTYFRGGVCPRGRRCRFSDSARALYSAGVASTRGSIAQTSAPNNGSLTITGSFTVTAQDNATSSFAIGTTVNKVGRTTGWTQGNVTATCVNTNVSGSKITQLCQTFVANPIGAVVVQGGDSGSGVFRITAGNSVQLVGILWGGNAAGTQFVFSPLKQVEDELGPLVATQ